MHVLNISAFVPVALRVHKTDLDPLKLESQKIIRWHELLGTELISSAKEANSSHH